MDFQGFQHIVSPALVIVIAILLLTLAWASYRKFESIPALSRGVLMALRGSAFVLILLLLLNPYFYSSKQVERKPGLAVFLDNSESVGIQKGDYQGLESYNQLLETLDFANQTRADVSFYSMGERIADIHPDSIMATENQTNLSQPVTSVLEMKEEVQAAVIISDGIITYGRNPAVDASGSVIPIYTIAIGDTSTVRDISVANVLTNSTGYTNTKHAIEAELSQSGYANNTVTVSLKAEGETLQSKQITFDTDRQIKKVQFELEATETGLKQYEITAEPLPGEWTEENNIYRFPIDILDSKVKILHIAFEIHPDVKAVRSVIRHDENNELTTLTWLGNNRFIEDLPDNPDPNLIIIHGAPPESIPPVLLNLMSSTPTLFFELSPRSGRGLSEAGIELITPKSNQVAKVNLEQLANEEEQPVMELPPLNLLELPTLYGPLRAELSELSGTALYATIFDGLNTDAPALAVTEQGNMRRGHVLPWGWFRLLRNPNPSQQNYTNQLFTNLISWTASDPDNRKLRVTPSKKTFTTAEAPTLNGSLRNERDEPENDGIIEIEMKSDGEPVRTFNMRNAGNGNYQLSFPRLSEGMYHYEATARKGNRVIETQSGEFMVSNSSSELTNTVRNDDLLRSIATNSGGNFFEYQNADALWDSLQSAQLLNSRTERVENYSFPVRSLFWFALVLLLLGTEWMLRKYYSLP